MAERRVISRLSPDRAGLAAGIGPGVAGTHIGKAQIECRFQGEPVRVCLLGAGLRTAGQDGEGEQDGRRRAAEPHGQAAGKAQGDQHVERQQDQGRSQQRRVEMHGARTVETGEYGAGQIARKGRHTGVGSDHVEGGRSRAQPVEPRRRGRPGRLRPRRRWRESAGPRPVPRPAVRRRRARGRAPRRRRPARRRIRPVPGPSGAAACAGRGR